MNKNFALGLALIFIVATYATGVLAQNGRSRQGDRHQSGNRQGTQKTNQRNDDSQSGRGQNVRNAGQGGSQRNGGSLLTANEKQGLILMREEEKLARDVYMALQAKWGGNVFANISRAESQHMNAVGNLLSQYGIADPIKDNTAGVFATPKFQQLYNTLVVAGSKSREDAFKVGLKIEEMDIVDLQAAMKESNKQDIQRVLGNLLRGSRNHLRAFAARLNAIGGTYLATSLSQADFDQIANSKQEAGNVNGRVSGRNRSQGGSTNNRRNGRSMGRGNGQGRRGRQ